jgi:hypothetical protein
VREAGYLYEGKILDGWNRYQAALKAKKQMRLEDYRGSDPVGFVLGKNLYRRHLTPGQRAEIVVRAHDWADSGRPERVSSDTVSPPKTTNEQMEVEAGASKRTVQRAKEKVRLEQAAAAGEPPPPPKPKKEDPRDKRITELEAEVETLKTALQQAQDERDEAGEQLRLSDAVTDGQEAELIKSLCGTSETRRSLIAFTAIAYATTTKTPRRPSRRGRCRPAARQPHDASSPMRSRPASRAP